MGMDEGVICVELSYGLRIAQHEVSAIAQRERECLESVRLQLICKLDQHIAAEHHVHAWKWRALSKVMLAKDHHIAYEFRDLVAALD